MATLSLFVRIRLNVLAIVELMVSGLQLVRLISWSGSAIFGISIERHSFICGGMTPSSTQLLNSLFNDLYLFSAARSILGLTPSCPGALSSLSCSRALSISSCVISSPSLPRSSSPRVVWKPSSVKNLSGDSHLLLKSLNIVYPSIVHLLTGLLSRIVEANRVLLCLRSVSRRL